MQKKLDDAQHGNRGGGALHSVATKDSHGFMASSDKAILDGFVTGVSTLVIENRTTDPASPAIGRIWLRTDL